MDAAALVREAACLALCASLEKKKKKKGGFKFQVYYSICVCVCLVWTDMSRQQKYKSVCVCVVLLNGNLRSPGVYVIWLLWRDDHTGNKEPKSIGKGVARQGKPKHDACAQIPIKQKEVGSHSSTTWN